MKRKYNKLKHCNDCDKTKNISRFGNRTGYQLGMLLSFCKECMCERQTLYRLKHRKEYNIYQLKYRHEHPIKK
jgi:hypothetical protein